MSKPKLAVYWAASCGGCEIALVNLHLRLLDVEQHFDFMFCPCLLDTKESEVEALADGAIAITLFNGAIRNRDNEHMARLLRAKSQVLIAFGACAGQGAIPALSNLDDRAAHFEAVYRRNPTIDNPGGVLPQPVSMVPEGELRLPELYERVQRLADVVEVDYQLPGCPPEPDRIWSVVKAVIDGTALPARGSVIGAGHSAVCVECTRQKEEKRISKLYRIHEVAPDRERCLLEQGLLCMGPATRDGCGALCPAANMPCTGCYGPPDGVLDQGAKMIAALGSVLEAGASGKDLLADPAGAFYKFSLASSLMGGRR